MTDHSERIDRELAYFQADKSLVDMDLWRDDTIPDVNHLVATITGPANSPYKGGVFHIHIRLPDKYPFAPPVIKFFTKAWHPNISSQNGDLSLSFLKDEWSPAMNLTTTLVAIQAILSDPELSEAQDLVVARQYTNDRTRFTKNNAMQWTQLYATEMSSPCTSGRRIAGQSAHLNNYMQ
ncbi:ubiquitin-conjugating enzyme E2 1 [Artemisia annua]|uniref:Ubiquitin-conjugating enzyme E2 1 n=1 Tax=Artemisia annua TaxID=35608 RepID=A0A2U1P6X5_ARTAN|nr:ubiquitin-conjugating enzyme E2 1 [Artemisia annua]